MDQDLIDADKVVLGRRWFAMLDGELVTGDVNKHHELLLTDHEPVALLPNLEELRQAARRAELMLGAVAHPDAAVIARWAAGKDFDEQEPESYWDELLTNEERARLRAEYAADGGPGEADEAGQHPHCRHEWNQTPGEADENGGRIYCLRCGDDGDA